MDAEENEGNMIEQTQLASALGALIAWLETWRDKHGAYQGFVVHRTEAKRMYDVHDTAWTQAAMIRGYGNLFRKSREERWRNAMTAAADLLASRYDKASGRIRHTGHEDERFQSLVSCALGVCALLSVADLVDNKRKQSYVALCADHSRRYWLDFLWVESEGAFKFSEIDHYSRHENRYVVNFNTMAAEALLALHRATGDTVYRDKALCVGRWLVARWNESQTYYAALLEGKRTVTEDSGSTWMPPGGFSYQFTPSQRIPDNAVTLYAGLSLRGLQALYRATGDTIYAEIIRAQAGYLKAMRDPETRLYYHTTRGGRILKRPQFVAGAGMTLLGLHEARDVIGNEANMEDTVRSILGKAYPNGSYPGFVGKNDTGLQRRNSGGVVWEDVAASVNWNAQWFEYLTCLVADPRGVSQSRLKETFVSANRRFIYRDGTHTVQIVSWSPIRSMGIYLYSKTKPRALLAVYPLGYYAQWRRKLAARKHDQ